MKLQMIAPAAIAALVAMLATAPAGAQTTTNKETVCRDGTTVHGTTADVCAGHGGLRVAAATTVHHKVTCKDGTKVDSDDGCTTHNGVESATSVTRTTTVTKKRGTRFDKDSADAMALCKDGMFSHAATRASACRAHGGVDRYLKSGN